VPKQAMNKFKLIRLTTTWTWGKNHHLPPYSILCAFPWGPHLNDILSWDSQMGIPKFPKLGFPQLCGPITLCVDLWLKWGMTKSFSPRQELSNIMLHVTCMQGNGVDSWFLMVGNQTANLIPGLSFGHNLCFKCPNGSCEPILDISISINF